MVDTLAQRLAATLAEHSATDQINRGGEPNARVLWCSWRCTCGEHQEWDPIEATARGLLEYRRPILAAIQAHVAAHLAETVARWLDEQAQCRRQRSGWEDDHGRTDSDVKLRLLAQAVALEGARDAARATTTPEDPEVTATHAGIRL